MAKRGRKKVAKDSIGKANPAPDSQPQIEETGFEEKKKSFNECEEVLTKRGRKKVPKYSIGKANPAPDSQPQIEETGFEEKKKSFNECEVQQRIAAIQAICNAETENLLSRLRFVRSCFSHEHLQTPVLQFFEENLPNLSVVKNDKYRLYELRKCGDELDTFGNTSTVPNSCGLDFSARSVKERLLNVASLQIPTFPLGEYSENQYQGLSDSLRTPGASGARLSVGMTPKSLRIPKHGEMLMSVHGSPLGLYKEECLEAIHESDDCNTTN